MGPARRWTGRTASALWEVARQSAFQENCSYTMAVRGLLDGWIGGGGSCFRQFVCGLIAWHALVTWNPDVGGGAFPVV